MNRNFSSRKVTGFTPMPRKKRAPDSFPYSGILSGYMMLSSLIILPQFWTGMVHFLVTSVLAR